MLRTSNLPVPERRLSRPISVRSLGLLAAALSIATFVGGVTGVIVGAGAGYGLQRWLAALPDAREAERKRSRQLELPVVVDLLAACMYAGANPSEATRAAASVSRSSIGGELRQVGAALLIGASADEAWRLVERGDLAAVSRVMIRSARSGAPASELLAAVGSETRESSRAAAVAEARRLGVRTAGPLGLCFLPAFVLIGVIPLVISLVQAWN
ncbi:MAG TPA: type II secretion system F family protein [Actinomycetes bacterium]|nr:type II secretion system F family protein [Actinomycetes bacterium]